MGLSVFVAYGLLLLLQTDFLAYSRSLHVAYGQSAMVGTCQKKYFEGPANIEDILLSQSGLGDEYLDQISQGCCDTTSPNPKVARTKPL